MNWALLGATLLPSLLIILGIVYGFGKWSSKIDANTQATEHLTEAYEKQFQAIETNIHSHDVRLENHETRLTSAEKEITQLKYKN
jgi:hypothetical protein